MPPRYDRRTALRPLLAALALAGALAACGGSGTSSGDTPVTYNDLAVPPLLTGTTSGGVTTFDLALAASTKQLKPGARTETYGFNGADFWGPTLVLNRGDPVRMNVRNDLAEETTVHWHGLLLPGSADGGPHQVVMPGATWLTPAFPVKNRAATYWYHPHMHMMTQKQLTLGAGGLIIVRDAEEAALPLPRTYGVDDIPLVLTSRRFTTTSGVANQFQYTTIAYGDYLLANGTMNAQVSLPRQVVRLRILNGEIERGYNLGFKDGRTFQVIGGDGGLLAAPVPVTRLVLVPGERYEILVDLSGDTVGSTLDLQSFNGPGSGLAFGFAGYENATSGEFGSLLNYRTFDVLHVRVAAARSGGVTALPATLVSSTYPSVGDVSRSRTVNITADGPGAPFTFDGLGFDMDRIDQFVTAGATESWTITAGTIFSHSFHIHGVQFKILARNGSASAVGSHEQGWKDTVYLPIREAATFIARFDETADASFPFMYHCHMVNHEDGGLMGQFTVH